MKRQEYLDLKAKHQMELEDFPIAYAFSDEQLEEALKKLGAKRKDCVTIFGHGDIVRKKDAKHFLEMLKRHTAEMHERLKQDAEFAEEAFLYEMDNHEYAINWTGDEDVLHSFGMDGNDIREWGLSGPWSRARRRHMIYAQELELI